MKKIEKRVAIAVSAALLATQAAMADPAPTTSATASTVSATPDQSLTYGGVTLYGLIDMAYAYQSHGVRLDDKFPTGLEYVVSGNSNRSIKSLAPNALSASKVGLKGNETLTDDLSAVFQLEAQFNPTSGQLVDGVGSIIENNGRAKTAQTANGDSSKSGQAFGGMAYAGISSLRYGTLTAGRQYNLLLDDLIRYDPLTVSHAFSVVGYQGAAQGGGTTEDARLDNSLKYAIKLRELRLSALFQNGNSQWPSARGYQFDAGWDHAALSVDVAYSYLKSAISATNLSAAQVATAPPDSVAATISDNTTLAAFARYKVAPWATLFAGYEHIHEVNPKDPLAVGDTTIGGYTIGVVNNKAFFHPKNLNYHWVGGQFELGEKWEFRAAYYGDYQTSYGAVTCHNRSASSCSGYLAALTAVGIYKVAKRMNVYSGFEYSHVYDGLASGFLHNNSIDPMVGLQVIF